MLYCKCEIPREPRGRNTKHGWKNCQLCGKVIAEARTVMGMAMAEMKERKRRERGEVEGAGAQDLAPATTLPLPLSLFDSLKEMLKDDRSDAGKD